MATAKKEKVTAPEISEVELTETEKNLVKDLNSKKERLTEEINFVAQQKLVLNFRQKKAEDFYEQIVEQEGQIAKTFTEKYGKGTIDIERGVFIPA